MAGWNRRTTNNQITLVRCRPTSWLCSPSSPLGFVALHQCDVALNIEAGCFQCAARALKYFRITWEDSYKCSSVYICTTSNTQQQKCLKYITQKRTRMKCSTNVFSKQGASHLLQSEVATVNRPAVHKNFQDFSRLMWDFLKVLPFWRNFQNISLSVNLEQDGHPLLSSFSLGKVTHFCF